MSLLIRNRAMIGARAVDPLSDAQIWTDFTNPEHYVLSGSVFTTIYNKGSGVGAVTILSTPTYLNGFYHNGVTEEARYSETVPIEFTFFAVIKHLIPSVNSYLFAGSPGRREVKHYANGENLGNIFSASGSNRPFSYASATASSFHVFTLRNTTSGMIVYLNGVNQGDLDSPYLYQSMTSFNLCGSSNNVGSQQVKEHAVYFSVLTEEQIILKTNQLINKHSL